MRIDTLFCRTQLVPISGIVSSYKDAEGKHLDVSALGGAAFLTPDTFEALKQLNVQVTQASGALHVTDIFRSWTQQQKAYDDWIHGRRSDYVAPPGRSFHGAGRAIDIDLGALNFAGIKQDQWLQRFWNIALPIGWRAIIAKCDSRLSEAWHFEYPGDWNACYAKMPNGHVAQCAVLDAGQWNAKEKPDVMFVQAQLNRVLKRLIVVDGVAGSQTQQALRELGLTDIKDAARKLITM